MALLSKDQILQAQDLRYEDVLVPEWGGEVRIRSLAGDERDEFEGKSLIKVKSRSGTSREVNLKSLRARLVAASAINEDGSPMFTPADVMRLATKSAAALERLFKVAQRLSGLGDDDVDELIEDFDSGPSDSSTFASPGTSAAPSPSSSLASPVVS